ncbi:hypothetical protein Fmac_005722 [Flemingia macrophylla]|uniref:Legume lectin domain-containing protein n=1 Tax=Flemingia macrophylla TaxID=520843 RepID=A0ABD1N8K1_9FABA
MALNDTKPVLMLLVPLLMLHRDFDTSFEFPNFSGPYANSLITLQGDAFESNGVIKLTKLQNDVITRNSAGRSTYGLPVRLWNAETGKVARFNTTFSFEILHGPVSTTGDGISFFLAPFQSPMPPGSDGGYLGLFSPHTALRNTDQNHIVAVEFDMHKNEWDPDEFPHIGIDVNSISSVTTVPWENDRFGLLTVFATVTYDPVSQILSVVVHEGPKISLMIDLRTVLPEWVRVGFSGSTGQLDEVHEIQFWTFSSSFD